MAELTNPQVALQAATVLRADSHSYLSVLESAKRFLEWLDIADAARKGPPAPPIPGAKQL